MGSCLICGRSTYHSHRQPEEREAYFDAICRAYTITGEPIVTGILQTCEHVKQGAAVAGTFQIPAGVPSRDNNIMAQPMTYQCCSNCLAQSTGAGASTVKGSYSVGDSQRYFGSKLQ